MEYNLNTDFNLYGAIDSAWQRLHNQKNSVNWRHEEAKKAIRNINEELFKNDLNGVLPDDVQKSLGIVIVPSLDTYDTEGVFGFENQTIGIQRNWSEKVGLHWQIKHINYSKNCLSDNLQSEIFLFLATLKNSANS